VRPIGRRFRGVSDVRDLLILGAGPAGLAAATVARALGLDALVLEGGARPGGQLLVTPTPIPDCPGLPASTGPALAEQLAAHLAQGGGAVRTGHHVERVDVREGVVTAGGEHHRARFLLLATGARPRRLGVPGERAELGRGPSPAARRYGDRYRDRAVLIVGGGDVALEEAVLFARAGARVILAHRGDGFRARRDFRSALEAEPRVDVRLRTKLCAIEGEPEVTRALLVGPEGPFHAEVGAVFVCAGLAPNSELVAGQVETDAQGFVVTGVAQRTSAGRLYAAGDVCSGSTWMAAAAIGQAATAVKEVERRIHLGDDP
jgi:thioredoxin reductase (NADPH)